MDELYSQYNFLFYQGKDGNTKIQVFLDQESETIWTTQKGMGEIFDVETHTINYHLKNIFESGELEENSVIRKIRITALDGKKYNTNFYNLDAIISVGYRVNSQKATDFRIWATSILKEYMIKGFAIDDERLKQGRDAFGKDYFEELLARIREIRASERRFYQKVTDIYATSIDYNKNASITNLFFKTVQNKLEYAVTKKTASEIVQSRADSSKPNMGLQTWKNAKTRGKVLKGDVSVAKNYLTEKEIAELNTIVNMYLDYAELQAKKSRPMTMKDWVEKLDVFLQFNEYDLLQDAGRIRADVAKAFAENEYKKYRVIQDREYQSDYDKFVDEIKSTGNLSLESNLEIEIQEKQKLPDSNKGINLDQNPNDGKTGNKKKKKRKKND